MPGTVAEGAIGLRVHRHPECRGIQPDSIVGGLAVELEGQVVEFALFVDEIVQVCIRPWTRTGDSVEVDVSVNISDGNAFVLNPVPVDVCCDGRFSERAAHRAVAFELTAACGASRLKSRAVTAKRKSNVSSMRPSTARFVAPRLRRNLSNCQAVPVRIILPPPLAGTPRRWPPMSRTSTEKSPCRQNPTPVSLC